MNACNHFEHEQWTFVLRRFSLWLGQFRGGGALPGLQGAQSHFLRSTALQAL